MKKLFLFVLTFFITFLNVYAEDSYLRNILIDGVELTEFNEETKTYDLKYGKDKEDIKIVFDLDTSLFQLQTTGNTGKLNYGLNVVTATITRKSDESKTDKVTYTLNITREDGRSSDNTLSSLTVGGKNIPLTSEDVYDVMVDRKTKSVEIKGVINDQKSSFVSGYGERIGNNAVSLSGETTKVEIKVRAENESIKTYTINIIKENFESSDATLKSLGISNLKYEFNPSVYEYNLSVKNDIDKVSFTPVANDEKAIITYDKEKELVLGDNLVQISVRAEDGTVITYKLNIKREEDLPVVANIEIDGIEYDFVSNKYDYEIETNLSILNFSVSLNDEDATSNILNNENLKVGSVVSIEVKTDEETLVYNYKIVDLSSSDEDEVLVNDNPSQEIETNLINVFLKKYEMYIGLGVFGIGLLSLLVAILTKPKNSQIM